MPASSKSFIPLIRYELQTGFRDILSMQSVHRAVHVAMIEQYDIICSLARLVFLLLSNMIYLSCLRRSHDNDAGIIMMIVVVASALLAIDRPITIGV